MTRLTGAWLTSPDTRAVCAMLTDAGHRALFVGGCVRDALLGRAVADIDLATDARPEMVLALAETAGLKAVPTGLAHGTVTLVVEGRPFEVTTFRRDIETYGRHAVVMFTDDIAADAARRDFTMNALYAEPDGVVVDPLGGLGDLQSGRVRFVGDPAERIAEDYLRILRFFRFHAWYGASEHGLDAAGLAACDAAQAGLDGLSRERVGTEITRLLMARDPVAAVGAMAETGILGRVLPEAEGGALAVLVQIEERGDVAPTWQRRLAALGWREDWAECLRLSRSDRRRLEMTAIAVAAAEPPAVAAYRHGEDVARDAALIRAAQSDRALQLDLDREVARGARARFPLRARDVALSGPALGAELARLEAVWIASDFRLDAAALRGLSSRLAD